MAEPTPPVLRIAAFISHPIQYFTPLWQELSTRPGVALKVYYFAKQGLVQAVDPGFGVSFAWDIDLLEGHAHCFLERRWPTRDPLDYTPSGLNGGLLRAVREGHDVVFISGYAHVNNWFLAAACRALEIPVLCFADSNLLAERKQGRFKSLVKRVALEGFSRWIAGWLAAGGATRRYLEHYGVRTEAIFICPYAVDVARFRKKAERFTDRVELRRELGIPEGKRVVMFCGKLVARKRPLDVVAAVQRLSRHDTVAVFVGDGELREEIVRCGSLAVVTGFVNQATIPAVLSLADVLVLSSENEPYGMVVAEAQCLGIPAVVSEACGCHGSESVVIDGVSGFVYPTGNTDVLAQQLERLLDDRELHCRMSSAARSRGEQQSQATAADGFLRAAEWALSRRLPTSRSLRH